MTVYNDKFKSDIKEALRHIRKLHSEVKNLVRHDYRGLRRIKAVFKAREAKEILLRTERLTQAVDIMFCTVQLGVTYVRPSEYVQMNQLIDLSLTAGLG